MRLQQTIKLWRVQSTSCGEHAFPLPCLSWPVDCAYICQHNQACACRTSSLRLLPLASSQMRMVYEAIRMAACLLQSLWHPSHSSNKVGGSRGCRDGLKVKATCSRVDAIKRCIKGTSLHEIDHTCLSHLHDCWCSKIMAILMLVRFVHALVVATCPTCAIKVEGRN